MDRMDCPVCGATARGNDYDHKAGQAHKILVKCPRCGDYAISSTCEAILKKGLLDTEEKRASVGHWLRLCQRDGGVVPGNANTTDKIEKLAKNPWFPSLHNQLENLLHLIAERSQGPGDIVELDFEDDQYIVRTRISDGMVLLLNQLKAREYFDS